MHGIPRAVRYVNDAQWIFGYLLLGAGALLALAVAAYYGYGYWSKTGMDDLTFESERPLALASVQTGAKEVPEADLVPVAALPSAETDAIVDDSRVFVSDAIKQTHATFDDQYESKSVFGLIVEATPVFTGQSNDYAFTPDSITTQQFVPASDGNSNLHAPNESAQTELVVTGLDRVSQQTHESELMVSQIIGPEATSVTKEIETESILGIGLMDLASNLGKGELPAFTAPTDEMLQMAGAAPSRIIIPAIDVDSNVGALKLLSKNTGYEWETPKGIVGHVPTSGNPGIRRQGWYFGHLESPLRREGNVFKRLPDIPALLKAGETIHIVIETDDGNYLYQVYKTDWVHEEDLMIMYSHEQDITLVTCYPTLVYDHRLLVTAALVGISKS